MTTKNQTLEAMARAIPNAGEDNDLFCHSNYPEADCTILAKAALAALEKDFVIMPRVLGDGMFDVMCGANDWNHGGLVLPDNVRRIHAAMISHLESKPPEN